MARFSYTAVSRTGSRVTGEMEAAARQSVVDALLKLGHLPVDVSETTGDPAAGSQTRRPFFSGLPSSRQITHFTRELAILLGAGLPLDQSLALLKNDAGSSKLQRLIGAVGEEIGNGKSLNEAMALQGGAFPPIYTNMVRIGEASGSLETVLKRIAETRERTEKLSSKALSQMLYPCLLVLMAIAAVVIMMTFVVPRFKDPAARIGGARTSPSRHRDVGLAGR